MIITEELRKKYVTTIGIECHVQLKTKTKLFAPVDNDARDAEPNTKVSVICLGMPGALPVLNQHAVELAIKAGKALNSKINLTSSFDRKHYFYPDLPKGYQITQFAAPIVGEGAIEVPSEEGSTTVRITRAHLEEDAGKSTHPSGADYSLVDLNRAGTPLLEIVSEPDMHSAAEARAYAHELYLLMKYADVSDADLYHGNMRFDVNISIAPAGASELGNRAEIKNINSFRSVERAVEFEVARQIEILEKGGIVEQETRGWDEDRAKTIAQRSKENAHDYRYFPDPDIPPLDLDQSFIDEQLINMPTLPAEYRAEFAAIGLTPSVIASLLEMPDITHMISDILKSDNPAKASHAKRIALWMVNVLTEEITSLDLPQEQLLTLSAMTESNKLSATAAKEIFTAVIQDRVDPEAYATEKGLLQESDASALEALVADVLAANQKAADDVRAGEMKAIGFLVGQIMKASQGRANPAMVQAIIKKQLG